jgi:hypothetical protein
MTIDAANMASSDRQRTVAVAIGALAWPPSLSLGRQAPRPYEEQHVTELTWLGTLGRKPRRTG